MAMQGFDPFEEGRLAATRGQGADSNPYAAATPEYQRWQAGFESVEGSKAG